MYWVWGFKKNEKSLFFELMTFIDRGKKMYKISLFFGVLRESKISFWYFLTFNANVSFWEKKSKAKAKLQFVRILKIRFTHVLQTQWTGMKYWQQKLHTTGLLRHQRSQKKKLKKPKPKVQYPKFQNFIIFSADME